MEKRRITLYVEGRLIDLARLDNLNLSKLFSEYLGHYLDTNGLDAINEKITNVEKELKALTDKKRDLLRSGATESREDQIHNKIWNQLQTTYANRRKDGIPPDLDESWITGPRAAGKCMTIGKKPLEALMELKLWYKTEIAPVRK